MAITAAILGGAAIAGGSYLSARQSAKAAGSGGRKFATTSAAGPLLGALFGTRADEDIGFIFDQPGQYGVFGDLPSAVQEFAFNPIPVSAAEQNLAATILDDPNYLRGLFQVSSEDLGALSQRAQDLALTGLYTDPTEAFRAQEEQFTQEYLPQLAEKYGLRGSPFFAAATRAKTDLDQAQAIQETNLREAAAARSLQALPVANALAVSNLALPINLSGDIFTLGSQYRAAEAAQRGRPLDVFLALSGEAARQPATIVQQGYPTASGLSQNIGALGGLLQGTVSMAGGFKDLFGGLGGPSAYDLPGPATGATTLIA